MYPVDLTKDSFVDNCTIATALEVSKQLSSTSWQRELLTIFRSPRIMFAQDLAWTVSRKVPGHIHDCYQLDYFYKGTGDVSIAGVDYRVKPGDLFIINPDVEHDFLAARKSPMEGITFKFDLRESGRGPLFPPQVGNLGLLSRPQQRELENYLRRACEEANVQREENHRLAAALLSVFFMLLLRYIEDAEQMVGSTSDLSQCQRVMEYVRRHYTRQITLADLARIAGLEPRYLCRKFSSEMGISPIAALTRERMQAAKQLLLRTKLPVGEIGLRVGYQDTYHFSKRFKEVTGVSPKRLRESG